MSIDYVYPDETVSTYYIGVTQMTTTTLNRRDVEIGMIDRSGFLITTTKESYAVVRNCLSFLKEQEGLPVDYTSEKEGMKYAVLTQKLLGVIPDLVTQDPDGVIPPRIENYFIIPGYQKVGSNIEKMRALAHNVAQKLRMFQLEVEVNEESSIIPKMDNEEEFLYIVMVTSVAQELTKVPKDHEVWLGIPSIIKIMVMTGEFEVFREMVGHTPPLLKSIGGLLDSYFTKIRVAIAQHPNFKEEWNPENSKECINKLDVPPPTAEVMQILTILQKYHQS